MKHVEIYTDGSCIGNPGKGGWAAILRYGDNEKIISGHESNTTNNRMELLAVINALEALKYPCTVTMYSDSEYIIKHFNEGRRAKVNLDLWSRLTKLTQKHQIEWVKVPAHADDAINNRVDRMARSAAHEEEPTPDEVSSEEEYKVIRIKEGYCALSDKGLIGPYATPEAAIVAAKQENDLYDEMKEEEEDLPPKGWKFCVSWATSLMSTNWKEEFFMDEYEAGQFLDKKTKQGYATLIATPEEY